jgi:pyrroline-5-carboxylate reductase
MKISVIGAGAMGGSTVEGLLKTNVFKAGDITIADPNKNVLEDFEKKGVSVTTDNAVAAQKGDVVMTFVKPWLEEQVLRGIKESLNYDRQLLVVVAAGVKSADVLSWLDKGGKKPHFFLCIPNIGISEKASMTFLVPVGATKEETNQVKSIFDEVGETIVTEERLLAAGCTIASCGIAYAMRYVRASVEGSVELGFKAADAQKIVLQTMNGAVKLLQATGANPEAEIDKVTTPGGVTIKGLNAMERNGFTNAVIEGLKAGLS